MPTILIGTLTARAQTTIPRAVREALRLKPGDRLAWRIENGQAILTKAPPRQQDDPFACFDEWASEADQRAYAGL